MNLICKDCRAEQEGDAKVCAMCGGSLVYEIVFEMSPRVIMPLLELKQARIRNIVLDDYEPIIWRGGVGMSAKQWEELDSKSQS